jgi:N6-adenosine-specific RNA methylase IME4
MATRGKSVNNLNNQTTLLMAPVREHSRKPEEFYRLVESLSPGNRSILAGRPGRGGRGTTRMTDRPLRREPPVQPRQFRGEG